MDSETASSVDEQVAASRGGPDTAGKHRILAELKRVEQESKFLEGGIMHRCPRSASSSEIIVRTPGTQEIMLLAPEEELEELDKSESVSTICEELLRLIEVRPDPLLPITNGPVNPVWDRWFEGPQDAQGCRCLIL